MGRIVQAPICPHKRFDALLGFVNLSPDGLCRHLMHPHLNTYNTNINRLSQGWKKGLQKPQSRHLWQKILIPKIRLELYFDWKRKRSQRFIPERQCILKVATFQRIRGGDIESPRCLSFITSHHSISRESLAMSFLFYLMFFFVDFLFMLN